MRTAPLRESQAAVALFRRPTADGPAYLCQWSDSWRALHFIGGHREAGETFRECAIREIAEELGLGVGEFAVPPEPAARLEYVAHSESAGVPTRYVLAVFETALTAAAACRAGTAPENAWVTPADIRRGLACAPDGRRVSPTVALILGKLGLHPSD